MKFKEEALKVKEYFGIVNENIKMII